jgi:mono/diheme cytochrome c family protein
MPSPALPHLQNAQIGPRFFSRAMSQRRETESMRRMSDVPAAFLVMVYVVYVAVSAATAVGQGRQESTAGNPEAKKLKNQVAATPKSIAAGQQTFQKFCASCHGKDAKGDGPMAPKDSHPPNLTDEVWTHGSTDGEIFTVISDGAGPKSEMKPFKSKLTAEEIWNVVNYLRSLPK